MVALEDDPLGLGRCGLQGCQDVFVESIQVAPEPTLLAQTRFALAVPGHRLAIEVIAQKNNALRFCLLNELQRRPERSHVGFGVMHVGKNDRAGDLHYRTRFRSACNSAKASFRFLKYRLILSVQPPRSLTTVVPSCAW